MTPDTKQVVELAKMGLSAVEIAESLGYEVSIVEALIAANTEVRRELQIVEARKSISEIEETELSFKDLEPLATAVLRDILSDTSVKDSVRADIAKYVKDQRLGLKKPKQLVINLNAGDFNERMRIARARKEELAKTIEVVTEVAA